MRPNPDSLPTDLAAAHAMIIAQREALIVAEAKAQNAEAEVRRRAFRTSEGEALAISIPRSETAVIRHFQERMPYGLYVPDDYPEG